MPGEWAPETALSRPHSLDSSPTQSVHGSRGLTARKREPRGLPPTRLLRPNGYKPGRASLTQKGPLMKTPTNKTEAAVAAELEALQSLSQQELRERWVELYKTPCPRFMKRPLLTRALAYRIQENAFGGLDRGTRRRLDQAAAALKAGRPLVPSQPKVKPGTRLLREWQGTTHEVLVLEKSVQYRDREWPSLSAVAQEITGAHWSGPRFFGLKEKRRGRK